MAGENKEGVGERLLSLPMLIFIVLLAIGIIYLLAPSVLTALFLGYLLLVLVLLGTSLNILYKKGIIPKEQVYTLPILMIGVALIMAGLAQKGILPMFVLTSTANAVLDTTLVYLLLILAITLLLAYIYAVRTGKIQIQKKK